MLDPESLPRPVAAETDAETASGEWTLDSVPLGEVVRVVAVSGHDAIARRLGELGLREGVEIEILQRAPLGDPTLFELCGYQLCLRRSEASRVRVAAGPDS